MPIVEVQICVESGGERRLHTVMVERDIAYMAAQFLHESPLIGLTMQRWDMLTPSQRRAYAAAYEWLCNTVEQLKLKDAGIK